jgi:pullulanase/glycogen debranching enzyme
MTTSTKPNGGAKSAPSKAAPATEFKATSQSRVQEGQPYPLGATWDGSGVNFSIFSANATKVELCLFDADGKEEIERIELPEFSNEIWHGYAPALFTATAYTAHTTRRTATASTITSC